MTTGNLTVYAATALLNSAVMPSTYYVQFHIGNPGPNAIANPAAETRRVATTFDVAIAGVTQQATRWGFNHVAATEDWTHLTLWDAASMGNPWWVIPLPAPLSVQVNNSVELDDEAISLSFVIWS